MRRRLHDHLHTGRRQHGCVADARDRSL